MRRAAKWSIATAAILLVLLASDILFSILSIHRAQPTEQEYQVAHQLVAIASKFLAQGRGESVFFEARRGAVTINVYGVTDPKKQDLLIAALGSVPRGPEHPAVQVFFFSTREVESEITEPGVTISNVKRGPLIREKRID